ncbi:MAG: hypothetical protein U0528_09100 [Anaerolineae bacterium]|nr:hypothetical protein [Anaerolineae bacterium]
MFRYWIPIAHGALGPLDELMVVAAFVIFVAMLVAPPLITWIRRQSNGGVLPTDELTANSDAERNSAANTDDHYRLD